MNRLLNLILAVLLLLACVSIAYAQSTSPSTSTSPSPWHVQIHGLSYHAKQYYPVHNVHTGEQIREEQYNWLNLGLGIRYQYNDDLSLQVGTYRNSYYSTAPDRIDSGRTIYACADYLPIQSMHGRMGLTTCATSGYSRTFIPALTARWGEQYSVTVRGGPSGDAGLVFALDFGIRL